MASGSAKSEIGELRRSFDPVAVDAFVSYDVSTIELDVRHQEDHLRRRRASRAAGPPAEGAPTAARSGGRASRRGDLLADTGDDYQIRQQAWRLRMTRPDTHAEVAVQ
jgi:hypothetical protein